MAGDNYLEDRALASLVADACDAFEQDFRYAEAMARQASALQSRREARTLRAA